MTNYKIEFKTKDGNVLYADDVVMTGEDLTNHIRTWMEIATTEGFYEIYTMGCYTYLPIDNLAYVSAIPREPRGGGISL